MTDTDTETDAGGTSVTITYLWCGLRICEKRGANETVLARYFPQGEVHNGQPLYYAQDQVGSVTALVNAEGHVVGRLKYDAYGNLVKSWGTLPDYRYAGLYAQPGTELYLATFRAYDPQTGRWLSRDPLREMGGINLYAYVKENPIVLNDPLGLIWKTIGTHYFWGHDAMRWWYNRWSQQIRNGMSLTMPGSNPKEYTGTTRDIIQQWVSDPNNSSRNCEHKIGTKRVIHQVWGSIYDEWQGKAIYTWLPVVASPTYQNYK